MHPAPHRAPSGRTEGTEATQTRQEGRILSWALQPRADWGWGLPPRSPHSMPYGRPVLLFS